MTFKNQNPKLGSQNPKPGTRDAIPATLGSGLKTQNLLLDPAAISRYWQMLLSLKQKYGPTTGTADLKTKQMKRPLMAGIDPMTWNTEIIIKENLHFRSDPKLAQFLHKMNITDPFQSLISDIARHEFGHWEYPRGSGFGCPADNVIHHETFLDTIHDELVKSRKFNEHSCKLWTERITNTVEDLIDNFNVFVCSKSGTIGNGQVLFWYLSGQEGSTYSAEYTMFVKLNLALLGNKEANALLEQFFAHEHEDDKGKITKIEKSLGEAVARLKAVFTPENIMDQNKWKMLAAAYTKEVIPFINNKEEPEMQMSAGDSTAEMSKGSGEEQKGNGKGKNKQEEKDSESEEGEESESGQDEGDEESDGGSGQDEEENDSEEDEKQNGKGKGQEEGKNDGAEGEEEKSDPFGKLDPKQIEKIMGDRRQAGKGIPFYLERKEALDGYYRSLSRLLKIKAKHGDLPKASYPVVPTRRRAFDSQRDESSACDLSKLEYDPVTKRMIPTVVTHNHNIDFPIRKKLTGFPGVAFALIDSSGSMVSRQGNTSIVPWGDQSGYHYSLLAFYGLLRQLEVLGILHKVEVSGAIFNDRTTPAQGLKKTKELLLNPMSGGTSIDISEVRKMLKGKEGALFPFISDGEIGNWHSIKDEFIALAKKQQFFMIQVGGASVTSQDLEQAGLPVYYVDSYKDVVGLVVDFTAKAYHKTISTKLEKEKMKLME